jgi:hypothetical protein
MKILTHLPPWLKNKYFIAFAVFCMVMLFLDKNDLFTQLQRRKELKGLEQSKAFYTAAIAAENADNEGLKNDPAIMEKFSREKFLMKRDDEEVFLVPENSENGKK